MADELFADTSGFYTLMVKSDDRHPAARRVMREAQKRRRVFVTTDHVIDETATLLKVRGLPHLLGPFFEKLDTSRAVRIEWTDPTVFGDARSFFLKHLDKQWSFTDCLSFLVMRRLRLREALTSDHHFVQAGFSVLLR